MTKHTRTAPPVPFVLSPHAGHDIDVKATHKRQRQADALLDQAAPLRYVPSMGKRLKAAEGLSDATRKTAHAALVAWNKP